jgi:hypothetical protein
MQLKGNFDPSFLSSILQLLCNEQRTGVLRMRHDDKTEVKIYIYDGYIIYATSTHKQSQLGFLLKSLGLISSEQLKHCLNLAVKTKKAIGKILVEQKIIPPADLKKAVRKQAEDIILNVFFWEKGLFEYNDAKLILKDLVVTNLDIMSIILEATRRIDEMSVLTKCIPSDQIVFRITAKASQQVEETFNSEEWRVFSLINGQRTVRHLIAVSGYDSFVVYKALNTLLSSGQIESCPNNFRSHTQRYLRIIEPYLNTLRFVQYELIEVVAQWPYTVLHPSDSNANQLSSDKLKELHDLQMNLWIQSLFGKTKPAINNPRYDFLKFYAPERKEEENIQDILNVLKRFEDPEKGSSILMNGLNRFIDNLFSNLFDALGPPTAHKLCQKVSQHLSSSENSHNSNALYEMISTRIQARAQTQKIQDTGPSAQRSSFNPILGLQSNDKNQDD